MKTILFTVLFIAGFAAMVSAQNNNDRNDGYRSIMMPSSEVTGWFIEVNNSASRLNSQSSRLPGIAGGFVMNNTLYLGVRAKSFTWQESYLGFDNIFDEKVYLSGGYAGIYIETGIDANDVVHVTFPLTLGGGGASYITQQEYPEMDDDFEIDFGRKKLSSSPFLVCEPGVNLEMNVTGFLKAYIGYSYRWLYGLSMENTSYNAFNGSNLNFGLKFGRF